MATFPSIDPSYGAQKKSEPIIRSVQYGDGYEARLMFGLNQNPKEWTLEWSNITEAQSDTIETFLDARAVDNAAFQWSPPDDSETYDWICPSWSKTMPYSNLANIQATFRQVFEP
tara:strand:- start:1697 stop:2041 length:345 start_codon:yes stop_codon:yes gene_type:complete